MVTSKQVHRTYKVNVWLTAEEWRKWRVWLAENNHSGSQVLSTHIRQQIGHAKKSQGVVRSKSEPTKRPKPEKKS